MRVVIAEDSVLLRQGLVRLLEDAGHEVSAEVGDGPALVAAIAAERPDVSVVDVRMPPSHTDEGLRASIEARSLVPDAPILILSQYVEERYAAELIATGSAGVGYLLKDRVADVRDFLAALDQVAAGGTVLDPDVVSQLLVRRRPTPLDELTAREREVLSLMAQGRTNSAIAGTLVITEGAVEKHIRNIFAKLGLPQTDADHRRVLAVLTHLAEG